MCDDMSDVVYKSVSSKGPERGRLYPDAEAFSLTEVAQGFQISFPSDRSFYATNDTLHVLDISRRRIGLSAMPDYGGQTAISRPAVDQFSGIPNMLISAPWAETYSGQLVTEQNMESKQPQLELLKAETLHGQRQVSPYLIPSPVAPEVFDTPSPLASTAESPWQDGVGQRNSKECHNLWKRVSVDAIVVTGTNEFVPQTLYKPLTEADKERYLERILLLSPIIFMTRKPDEWGISLEDALHGRLRHLADNDEPVLQGCGPSVSIRINWPGYPSFKRQIPSRNWSKTKDPITKGKLAQRVAKATVRFIEKMWNKPLEVGAERRWKVGPQHIKLEDLVLVSLHHVSKGSWQPQFRLKRSGNVPAASHAPLVRSELY